MTAIVIFTKNEEKIISQLIDDLYNVLKTLPSLNFELFLCDDSTDKTQEIAKKKKLNIISGKGSLGWSYYFALSYLSKGSFENIITLDGDGQTDLSEIPAFLQELQKGHDLVVGSRFLNSSSISYPYSKWNFMGVKMLSFIISFCALQKFTDSHGGLRAMKFRLIKDISFLGTHSYVQETIISAKSHGFKVKELDSKWNKRPYGESRVVHSKIKYIKAMALPLLLRMKAHWIFSIVFLILCYLHLNLSNTRHFRESGNLSLTGIFNIFQNNFYLILAVFFGLFELYKRYLFIKNKKQIKKWMNDE
ncbi:MAG: glycosyltransferase family 2 protein [Oligoflexia bacterium]|nr:glycosyltransferase family 2 protein [Oligoflexia bacterium]